MKIVSYPRVLFALIAIALAYPAFQWVTAKPPQQYRAYVPNPKAVAPNRGHDVADEFPGDVHPLLHGKTELKVTAFWSPVVNRQDTMVGRVPNSVYGLFENLKIAKLHETYTERDFSKLLPDSPDTVGKTWALDLETVANFLKQFHPRPSMNLIAEGRRAGPDGAFAILRAISSTHLDIVFRIHTEFNLLPDSWSGRVPRSNAPLTGVWYTPAHLSGNMLVDKTSGTVKFFKLALPVEKSVNVMLTVGTPEATTDLVVVPVRRMELSGGQAELGNDIKWEQEISLAEAQSSLRKMFYKFMDIEWVPIDQALKIAAKTKRPIFAAVSWGGLDDQSC